MVFFFIYIQLHRHNQFRLVGRFRRHRVAGKLSDRSDVQSDIRDCNHIVSDEQVHGHGASWTVCSVSGKLCAIHQLFVIHQLKNHYSVCIWSRIHCFSMSKTIEFVLRLRVFFSLVLHNVCFSIIVLPFQLFSIITSANIYIYIYIFYYWPI